MRKPSGFRLEEVITNQEISGRKLVLDFVDIRLRIGQILSEDVEGSNALVDQAFHHLGNHQTGLPRKLFHTPRLLEFRAGIGVRHGLVSRKHIRQSPHVAGSLNVVLAAERVHAATLRSHVPEQHLQIGDAQNIVHATRVLGDSERIADHDGLDGRKASGGLPDEPRFDAADFGGALGRVLHHGFFQGIEAHGAGFDKPPIIDVFRDEDVHDGIEKSNVAADLQRKMKGGMVAELVTAWIDDDQFRTV